MDARRAGESVDLTAATMVYTMAEPKAVKLVGLMVDWTGSGLVALMADEMAARRVALTVEKLAGQTVELWVTSALKTAVPKVFLLVVELARLKAAKKVAGMAVLITSIVR